MGTKDERDNVTPLLQRPDPNILSESIPAYFVGRNRDGFYVARDADAPIGGIFLLEKSALRFANKMTSPTRCAIILISEHFELDVENRGNPLVAHLGRLKRFVLRHARRLNVLMPSGTVVEHSPCALDQDSRSSSDPSSGVISPPPLHEGASDTRLKVRI
jgi:hypothetical protein